MRPYNDQLVADILEAARCVFLQHGYDGASMRAIAAAAGVTTGAIYRYYRDKEALFEAMVGGPANKLLEDYRRNQEKFAAKPYDDQIEDMHHDQHDAYEAMLSYMYKHYDAFKLLASCSKGTKYEDYVERLAEIEDYSSRRFMKELKEMGHAVRDIDPGVMHMLSKTLFNGMFETIRQDMSQERAATYLRDLKDFYAAGWYKILGIQQS